MRLIDADALFNAFEESPWYDNMDRDEVAEEILLNQATIDAEPVRHGKLVSTGVCALHCEIGKCVECKGLNIVGAKYCQWCGAKMDGGSEVQE